MVTIIKVIKRTTEQFGSIIYSEVREIKVDATNAVMFTIISLQKRVIDLTKVLRIRDFFYQAALQDIRILRAKLFNSENELERAYRDQIFHRDLLTQIAKLLGEPAFTTDAGTVMGEPVVRNIPALVSQDKQSIDRYRGLLAEIATYVTGQFIGDDGTTSQDDIFLRLPDLLKNQVIPVASEQKSPQPEHIMEGYQ